MLTITQLQARLSHNQLNLAFLTAWLKVRGDRMLPHATNIDQALGDRLPALSIAKVEAPDRVINISTSSVTKAISGYDLSGQNYVAKARGAKTAAHVAEASWRRAHRPCGSFGIMPYANRQLVQQEESTMSYTNMSILCLPVAPTKEGDPILLYFAPEASDQVHANVFVPNAKHSIFGWLEFDFLDIGNGIDPVPFPED